MKKNIFGLLAIMFLWSLPSFGQWQSLDAGTSHALGQVFFTSHDTGYAAGGSGDIIKTTNGGLNWNLLPNPGGAGYNSIYFCDANTGFAAGGSGEVVKTTNAGLNWTLLNCGTSGLLHDVYFLNANTGYIVGLGGNCRITTNGGVNWSYQTIPNNDELLCVRFNAGKGFIGSYGTSNLYTSVNNGVDWIDAKFGTGIILTHGIFFHGNTGVAVGAKNISGSLYPTMFKTSNNGLNWIQIILPDRKARLRCVAMCPINNEVIYAAGEYANDITFGTCGFILRSTNGGVNWTEYQYGGNDTYLMGMYLTSTDCFIAGGTSSSSVLIKSAVPIGITPGSTEIPQDFTLSQNYPNPFNPTTNINFAVKEAGVVKMYIFNSIGQEVAVLVNEHLAAGTYTVDFNAGSLTSGIYFYRMVAKNFTETKKMVLVK